MKEICFVTSNIGKVETARQNLKNFDIDVLNVNLNIEELKINDIELICKDKVMQAYQKVQRPVITLDAGFYIPNFPNNPNFPGAFPRRDLIEKMGILGLLENMKNIKDRKCYFRECLSYYDGKVLKQFNCYHYGTLTTEIRGNDKNYKWSDLWSVFIPSTYDKTLAEMTRDEYLIYSANSDTIFQNFANWFLQYTSV